MGINNFFNFDWTTPLKPTVKLYEDSLVSTSILVIGGKFDYIIGLLKKIPIQIFPIYTNFIQKMVFKKIIL